MSHATPTTIKLQLGNPSGRPINENEPKAIAGAPMMPATLDSPEQVYWHDLCATLSSMGTLSTCDSAAMRLFCEAAVIRDQAREEIRSNGITIHSAQGRKKNPAVTIFNEQAHTLRTLIYEFGLTPSSRTKIHAEGPEAKDDFEKLLDMGAKLKLNVRDSN